MWLCIPPFLIWAGWPWANRFSSLCCSFYMYERGQDQKLEVTDLKHQLGTKGKPSIPRVSECPPAKRNEWLLGLHIPLVCISISTLAQACRFPARSRKRSLRQCIIWTLPDMEMSPKECIASMQMENLQDDKPVLNHKSEATNQPLLIAPVPGKWRLTQRKCLPGPN